MNFGPVFCVALSNNVERVCVVVFLVERVCVVIFVAVFTYLGAVILNHCAVALLCAAKL